MPPRDTPIPLFPHFLQSVVWTLVRSVQTLSLKVQWLRENQLQQRTTNRPALLQRQVDEMKQNWKAAQSREEFARMDLEAQGSVIADLQQTIADAQGEEAA